MLDESTQWPRKSCSDLPKRLAFFYAENESLLLEPGEKSMPVTNMFIGRGNGYNYAIKVDKNASEPTEDVLHHLLKCLDNILKVQWQVEESEHAERCGNGHDTYIDGMRSLSSVSYAFIAVHIGR